MTKLRNTPLVSVLTPSFNSEAFIEETIASVKVQDYPRIEHIIVDGGSSDSTVNILRGHSHLRWISEPDQGQSDALNKAFSMAKGDIIGWLNADDLYEPNIIMSIVAYFADHPDAMVVYGNCSVFDPDGSVIEYWHGPYDRLKLFEPWRGFHGAFQPAIFYRRELIERIGGWMVDLHYVMDYDILLRASEYCDFDYLNVDIARFRRHPQQKGALAWHKFVREFDLSVERHWRGKGVIRQLSYTLKARDFYALALLEEITQSSSVTTIEERSILIKAVLVSPLVLRFPWVRRRYFASLLGSKFEERIKKTPITIRDN
ncbi:MAG: glycosyltransferase family 2 protein [Nitrosomonas ureae]